MGEVKFVGHKFQHLTAESIAIISLAFINFILYLNNYSEECIYIFFSKFANKIDVELEQNMNYFGSNLSKDLLKSFIH